MTAEREVICRKIACRVLDAVLDTFDIEPSCASRMRRRLNGLQLLLLSDGAPPVYPLRTVHGRSLGTVKGKIPCQSHLLECPPLVEEGKLTPVEPVVCVLNYRQSRQLTSSLVHELVHLYASGEWYPVSREAGQTVLHRTGCAEFIYEYGSGDPILQSARHTVENEVMTDFLAAHIYPMVTGESYASGGRYTEHPLYALLAGLERKDVLLLGKACFQNDREALLRYT